MSTASFGKETVKIFHAKPQRQKLKPQSKYSTLRLVFTFAPLRETPSLSYHIPFEKRGQGPPMRVTKN
jgi:hypothetical protein